MAERKKYEEHGVIPLVLDAPPPETLSVEWKASWKKCEPGDELTPTEVKTQPIVDWRAYDDRLYTVLFVNLGSKSHPTEAVHWLVYNLPGDDVTKGRVHAEYIPSCPADGTGLHRYVYLVYQQPESAGKITPKEDYRPRRLNTRTPFSTREFVKSYGLGVPVAANFYLAKYDDYVPELLKELSGHGLLGN